MRRVILLTLLVAAGAASVAVSAMQSAGEARTVEVEKLRDNLFVLRGGGGNSTVFVGEKGVVVVDTKNPGWGQPLLAKIGELTNKPVTMIINTHTHGDHVSGNVEFPANVEIVTHVSTKANMEKMAAPTGSAPATANIFKEHNGKGMPTRTFDKTLTVGSGNDRIDLFYFGRGHTNGDAWVVFPALRAMAAGDIFRGKSLPLLDANNGGSGVEIGDSLARAADGISGVDSIVTGHTTVMTMSDLREYAAFNRDFLAMVREGKRAGRAAEEIAKGWTMPPKYMGYEAPQANRLRNNIQVILDELR